MGITSYGIGDITEEVQGAPGATATCHTRVRRRVPPTEDYANRQWLEKFHHIQRLTFDHHLVSHVGTDNDGKESCQSHGHLENPPERPLAACERGIGQELVGSEYHVINLFFEKVDSEIYCCTVVTHRRIRLIVIV